MESISTIKTDLSSFGDYQLEQLFNYIGEMLTVGTSKSSLNENFKESRFSKSESCPHCQSTSIIKNGKLNERQR